MARYRIPFVELWRENSGIIDEEIVQLTKWLHESGIDPDFDPDDHVYVEESGDRTFSLPELTLGQQFAMGLVVSSSTIELDGPVRFATPPNQKEEPDE